MNSIFLNFIVQSWYILPILAVFAFFRTSIAKGMLGEFLINVMARLFLDKKEYHLIKNVTIPIGAGTAQIDHIIVSQYGLFVVETKNMRGWIYGGEKQEKWTQKIYKHTKSFQNPLHQNYKHVLALAELIGIDAKKVFSLVVFIGDSEFKTPMPANVTAGRQYIRYIKSHTTPLFGEHDVIEILERIKSRRLAPNRRTHKEHVHYINALHLENYSDKATSSPLRRKRLYVLLFIVGAVFFGVFQSMQSGKTPEQIPRLKETKPEAQEYRFSDDEVKDAMERVLRAKMAETEESGPSPEPAETLHQYEIVLHSGGKIYSDNAAIGNDVVRYTSDSGLIIAIDRDEIAMLKKIKKN